MTITEYVATTARAFMAAEIAMASVNYGAAKRHPSVCRKTARRLLCPRGTGNPLDGE